VDAQELTPVNYIWFAVSMALLLVWVRNSNWGRRAFSSAPAKGHSLGASDILLIMLVYIASELVRAGTVGTDPDAPWAKQNLSFLVLLAGQFLITVMILYLAHKRFPAGWRRLGVSGQRPIRTVFWSAVYFVAATGWTLLMLGATLYICRWAGYEEIQKHTILEKLSQPGTPFFSQVLMIVTAAAGAPVAEELLFRGILQNYLVGFFSRARSRGSLGTAQAAPEAAPVEPGQAAPATETPYGRWMGILSAAVIFAIFHSHWQHMPALVVLGIFLGYVYERRGNLLMPIIVHSLFNALMLAATLLQAQSP